VGGFCLLCACKTDGGSMVFFQVEVISPVAQQIRLLACKSYKKIIQFFILQVTGKTDHKN
jgi:hypothetical protein